MTDDKPQERVLDASAMKAFAHPLRMAMYNYLTDHGSATATMLAQHLDESTGQTSYHLRQLERHGFVEEDTGRGSGRERWWKPVSYTLHGTEVRDDPSAELPVRMMLQATIDHRATTMSRWLEQALDEPQEWVEATVNSSATAPMTLAEATSMRDEVFAVLVRHLEAAREAHPDPDDPTTRRMRVYFDSFPLTR
ncbi:winged helix-turn-helix domain-containing protein [Ornithinimicrobium sediminis]|uniref:winged helix-turn-helix domain-containing protein n=1 Tax=Ornithinimicrobium sediminis TaxID=2904603 RepID=UPI001E5C3DEA|nr:helix-turn-helix domain-containing protein [Ornithinimicrobium sediminis]MCE0487482.1 helix-turn-helix domain-containing protein [Ornithinimicrobium sediminis]